MDIANKKRTYVWGVSYIFFWGERLQDFYASTFLYPYIIKLVYYFSSSVKELKD